MRIEQGFQPVSFKEDNPYISDSVLPALLKRTLPRSTFQEVEPELVRLGADVLTTVRALGGGNRTYPPRLIQYDQWGKRIDELQTSEGWRDLKAFAQSEGIPAIFYERKYGEYSRTYGFAKVLLLVGETQSVFCPLSMTDGVARVIELIGTPKMKKEIYPRLISRDPSVAFTSGQWMTERPGGSDVSQTETLAVSSGKHNYGPQYTLNGFKWFSSANDSEISVALARTGSPESGSRGLSLFLVPLRLPLLRTPSDPVPSSTSNGIFIHRLKNKIGTLALPTAELSLESTEAYLLGPLNQGVKNITPVLNITRLWSSTASLGNLRKCLAIATAFAKVRVIGTSQQLLKDSPIHVSQLVSINLLYRALAHLTFGVIRLLGRAECGTASPDELRRLRLLTPVVKAYAAEKTAAGIEEAMTTLGGAGYMEENGFGVAIRDVLVEKIWEGTTNILALDLRRSLQDQSHMNSLVSWATNTIDICPTSLKNSCASSFQTLRKGLEELSSAYSSTPISPLVIRPALLLTGAITSSIYLLEHASWAHTNEEASSEVDIDVFQRWVIESGIDHIVSDIRRAKSQTDALIQSNSRIVFNDQIATSKL